MTGALRAVDLSERFRSLPVLDGLSLDIPRRNCERSGRTAVWVASSRPAVGRVFSFQRSMAPDRERSSVKSA